MATFDYENDDGEIETIWMNPDVPGLQSVLDAEGQVQFDCPNPECNCELDMRLDELTDVGYMIGDIEGYNDGTMRCPRCEEPLYGMYGEHDGLNYGGGRRADGWTPGILYD